LTSRIGAKPVRVRSHTSLSLPDDWERVEPTTTQVRIRAVTAVARPKLLSETSAASATKQLVWTR
jgi:hypothetical protein